MTNLHLRFSGPTDAILKENSEKNKELYSIAGIIKIKRILSLTTEICSSSKIKHGSNFNWHIDQLLRISNNIRCQTIIPQGT